MESLKLSLQDARNVAMPHKTRPFWEKSTPRWLEKMLEVKGIENAIYQINKVTEADNKTQFDVSEYEKISQSNINFTEKPDVLELYAIETIIKIPSKVDDIFNLPHNQKEIQIHLTLEKIFERKELLLFYFGHTDDNYDKNDGRKDQYGLLNYCVNHNKVLYAKGAFSLDYLDHMLSNVWIKPTFFVLHPDMLYHINTLCTQKGIHPETTELMGHKFATWRGIPLLPTDKLKRPNKNIYDIFLIRSGESDNGVVQLINNNISYEQTASLVVKENSTDDYGMTNLRISYYFNVAVLSSDAIFMCQYSVE
jgi:hypothetical protein